MPDPLEAHNKDALHRLCAHFGIATDYNDVQGTRHEVARDSLIALLSEFGVRLEGEMTAEHALEGAQRQAFRRPLPPVVAISAAETEWSVRLRLPAAEKDIHWQISEEGGALHQGETSAHDLPELRRVMLDGVWWCERRLPLSVPLPMGYHRLTVMGLPDETLVVSAPLACYRPEALPEGGRIWGPAVQLYSLRSERNWGMGDFTDLAHLIAVMAERGADIVGLNPLHALFPHNPAHASPYSPSSRQQLNTLYIDVEAVNDFAACEAAKQLVISLEFQDRLARLRESALVDYVGVAAAKFQVLELLFASFREQHLSEDGRRARDESGRAFLAFVAERGEALYGHALFEALQARFHAEDSSVYGPAAWPKGYLDTSSAAVQIFADQHFERIQYHQYLQWIAALQLARASEFSASQGMTVGLYLDLAVSVDRAGSDAWREHETFAAQASVGAPPDDFNPEGQGWGLPPPRPDRMREGHYRLFIETLRANMRVAGALRIDHVMGLMRLFWIPPRRTARDGAYVHYRLEEALAIVAIESQRARCLVIGEDLGTVTDDLRGAMARFDVLSYRLLYFERSENGDFKPPEAYPRNALVAIGTHDLATLPGWLKGQDLRVRHQLGQFPNTERFEMQLLERAKDRVRLMLSVQHQGLLSSQEVADSSGHPSSARVVEAVHLFLAQAPSVVMMVQLEDSLGVIDQINLPGTTEEQPNWRRKLQVDLQGLSVDPQIRSLTDRLAGRRPRSVAKTEGE